MVHNGELVKDTLGDLFLQLTELLSDVGANDVLHKALGEQGRQLRLESLVVNDLALDFGSLDSGELSAASTIPQRDEKC